METEEGYSSDWSEDEKNNHPHPQKVLSDSMYKSQYFRTGSPIRVLTPVLSPVPIVPIPENVPIQVPTVPLRPSAITEFKCNVEETATLVLERLVRDEKFIAYLEHWSEKATKQKQRVEKFPDLFLSIAHLLPHRMSPLFCSFEDVLSENTGMIQRCILTTNGNQKVTFETIGKKGEVPHLYQILDSNLDPDQVQKFVDQSFQVGKKQKYHFSFVFALGVASFLLYSLLSIRNRK